MIGGTTANLLIALVLSGVFLLATIGAASKNKAALQEYASLGAQPVEEELRRVEKTAARWKWAAYIFSILTPIPLTAGLHFFFSLSSTTGFIIVNLGGEFAVVLAVFFLTRALKTKWNELFTSKVSVSSCSKLMMISFCAVLTMLTLGSLLFDPQLRASLLEQLKKAFGGR